MLKELNLATLLFDAVKDSFDATAILLLIAGIVLLARSGAKNPGALSPLVPIIVSAVMASLLAFVFPSFAPSGEWRLFLLLWLPILIHIAWNAWTLRSSQKENPVFLATIAEQGIAFLGFILLACSLLNSYFAGTEIDWRAIHASGILLIVFYLLMVIAPWRFFGFTSNGGAARVLIYLAIGVFILRGGMWSYGLFHAASKERPGSFRLKGIMYSESMAKTWRFPRLHSLIMDRWYYPVNPNRSGQASPIVQNSTLLEEGFQKAEAFRRSFFDENDKNGNRTGLIAQAIIEFQIQSKQLLKDHFTLDRFKIDRNSLIEQMSGIEEEIDIRDSFAPFTGRWFGIRDTVLTDHQWRPLETYNPPLSIPGRYSVKRKVQQYGWMGDRFIWNAIVTIPHPTDPQLEKELILGIAYSVKDQNPSNVVSSLPQLGLPAGFGQIIWIASDEIIFAEMIPNLRKYNDCYAMTGFNYIIDNSTLKNNGKAFQALYSRNPSGRKSYNSFDIRFEIKDNPELRDR